MSEDAMIKRRLLCKSRDMPQRRFSLDLQCHEGMHGLKRVGIIPNISDSSFIIAVDRTLKTCGRSFWS